MGMMFSQWRNPDLADGRIGLIPLVGKGLQGRFGVLKGSGLINGFEVSGDHFAVFPKVHNGAVANQMHDAQLHLGLGGIPPQLPLGKAFEPRHKQAIRMSLRPRFFLAGIVLVKAPSRRMYRWWILAFISYLLTHWISLGSQQTTLDWQQGRPSSREQLFPHEVLQCFLHEVDQIRSRS